jgi:hypothetical protein
MSTAFSPTTALEERFWCKVDKQEDGCWHWLGSKNKPGGYGRFRIGMARIVAHRFSYELLVGPIGDGLEIDHLCCNPGCVNPAHLETVTHRENMRRRKWPNG